MSNQPEKQTKQLKTIGLVIIITIVGKILGLVRDMMMGHNFATGMDVTAFQVASRIPRTFFDAIFASAISASFIPVFADRMENHGKEDAFRLSGSFFTWVGLTTAAFSALGIVFADPIVTVLADGFDAETAALCARLLRILFPTVFFTGLAFSMVGVLQSMGEFNIPAAMSVASNTIIIVYYLLFCRQYGVFGLAWAFVLGWAAQALMQMPWLHRHGFRYRPALWHPGLKQVFSLMLPVMVSTWIQPVNQLISTRFATHLFSGAGASAMDYANTLYTMITGILVLSITNVIFPEMSKLSTVGKEEELNRLIVTNIRGMLFLLLPLTVGVMVMSEPVVRLLFQYGAWDDFSTTITARALMFMSIGMVGYGIQNVLSRAFYAGQDGKMPLISGVISIGVNFVLCMTLSEAFDVAGLSFATAVSSTVAALVLLIPTVKKAPQLWNRDFWLAIFKMLACSVLMGAVVWGCHGLLSGLMGDGMVARAILMGVPTVIGIVVYFAAAFLLRLQELDVVRKFLKK